MATTFEIMVAGTDLTYARQAAQTAFAETDRLEQALSRFIEHSDVSRINRRRGGESVTVGHDAFTCLRVALEVCRETDGAFDATYLSDRKSAKNATSSALPKRGYERLALNERDHSVTVLTDGVQVDLGAIGKGYALDQMAVLLEEWGVNRVLLHSGTSSILALDPPPDMPTGWPVGIGEGDRHRIHPLTRAAIGASGIGVQGLHIIDPRTGEPIRDKIRLWVMAPNATLADAYSTALMVMSPAEAVAFAAAHQEIRCFEPVLA